MIALDTSTLEATARELVGPGRGVLAADEDDATVRQRFAAIGVRSDEETRRRYRQLLFTTPGLAEHVSGVILFEETLRQVADDGRPMPCVLEDSGVIPGITVDRGSAPLAAFPGETVTEGLDGLRERLGDARALGARFAKWRSVLVIGDGRPTAFALEANAHASARYAALCQEAGVVPIVEPDVLMAGDHTIERSEEVSRDALHAFYAALERHRVHLAGTLLKTNMVLPGAHAARGAGVDEVADATIRCLLEAVPPTVPGVLLLSGGQRSVEATAHLDAMNRRGPVPWELSFAFGRALQMAALEVWAGDDANAPAAQAALAHRARMNGLARSGSWSERAEEGPRR